VADDVDTPLPEVQPAAVEREDALVSVLLLRGGHGGDARRVARAVAGNGYPAPGVSGLVNLWCFNGNDKDKVGYIRRKHSL